MALALRYYSEFVSSIDGSNDYYRIEIHQNGFSGTAEELQTGASPAVINYNEGDIYSASIGSGVDLTFISPSNMHLLDLYSINPKTNKIIIYKNSNIIWSGWVESETYEESYDDLDGYEVTITGNDGITILDRFDFTEASDTSLDSIFTLWDVIKKSIEIMETDINRIGVAAFFKFKDKFGNTDGYDRDNVLETINSTVSNFIDEDGERKTIREVLDEMLKSYGLQMRLDPSTGNIYIYDTDYILKPSYDVLYYDPIGFSFIERVTYDQSMTEIDMVCNGGNKTFNLDKVGNKFTIEISPYTNIAMFEPELIYEDMKNSGLEMCEEYYDDKGEDGWVDWIMKMYPDYDKWERVNNDSYVSAYFKGDCTDFEDDDTENVIEIRSAQDYNGVDPLEIHMRSQFSDPVFVPGSANADFINYGIKIEVDLQIIGKLGSNPTNLGYPGSGSGLFRQSGWYWQYYLAIETSDGDIYNKQISVQHNNERNPFNNWFNYDDEKMHNTVIPLEDVVQNPYDSTVQFRIGLSNHIVFAEEQSDYESRVAKILIKNVKLSIVPLDDTEPEPESDYVTEFKSNESAKDELDDVELQSTSNVFGESKLLNRAVTLIIKDMPYMHYYKLDKLAKKYNINDWVWLDTTDLISNKILSNFERPKYIISGVEEYNNVITNFVLNIIKDSSNPSIKDTMFKITDAEIDLYNGITTYTITQQTYDYA